MVAKKLVLFGAGKLGRSFIAQLFCKGGYETVFVDSDKNIIHAVNKRRKYPVIIKGDKDEVLEVSNIRGVWLNDEDQVIREILTTDIMAVAVGQTSLSSAIPLIAKGLIARYKENPQLKLDIIIAENLRNAAEYFTEELPEHLPFHYPLHQLVGLVETSIGKMIPLMTEKDIKRDILRVYAEPFNTLILDGTAFKNPRPEVEGLAFKKNMKAWIDRKSYILNLGHAAVAYLGYLNNPGYTFTWEVLENPSLYNEIKETMLQSAAILQRRYPEEFTIEQLAEHVNDLLHRFQNKHLGDTLFRVGCDLYRKLSPSDRLSGAIRLGLDLNMPVDRILYVLVAGIYFQAVDDNGKLYPADEQFHQKYHHRLEQILREVCGFEEDIFHQLYRTAKKFDLQIQGLT